MNTHATGRPVFDEATFRERGASEVLANPQPGLIDRIAHIDLDS